MRSQPRNCTAIKALLLAALLLGGSAWAAPVAGMVTHLSGPLLAKKADGKVKILSLNAEVEQGDTLMSEKNTYAQIRFIDNSEMIVRPGTTFTIENFTFDPARPDGDSATFSLVKGSLRSTTGLLGKRNKEKFSLKTPTGTIGIHGTTFIAHYVPPPPPSAGGGMLTREDLANRLLASGSQGKSPVARDNLPGDPGSVNQPVGKNPVGTAQPPAPPVLPPGLHLGVTDGAIIVTNNGGSLGFQAGQFGYVPSFNQPPVIVPPNPGIQFVPPPSFFGSTTGPSPANGNSGNANAVDCIVR